MSKKEPQWEITITADTNDADYVTSIHKISESHLEKIKPLIQAIKKFKPYFGKTSYGTEWEHAHNYPLGDGAFIPRKDLGEKTPHEIYHFPVDVFDAFDKLCPYSEHGFHTIESVEVTPFVKKTNFSNPETSTTRCSY